jgi:hypothetical protein
MEVEDRKEYQHVGLPLPCSMVLPTYYAATYQTVPSSPFRSARVQ